MVAKGDHSFNFKEFKFHLNKQLKTLYLTGLIRVLYGSSTFRGQNKNKNENKK